ncbi:glycosyltransferase family 4 protein [Microcoleus sp. FACHB-SPT15]|uniref:glycosyltransferase family 4 protein n=1 Tax=Microcoleus sp. FACHB-SPT15 TaxID=2692830 RepID=UPI00177DAE7C|nr:glycosyltransferase family 4 protein [Microcoleus sp. FACHB-SPT15]MBD1804152.1 glycosyltransferase family 4 protein [Microcoleus sp. FACHB-SPT15]
MSYPRISLIHPTGNPFSRQAAIAFAEVGLLQEVITTIAYDPEGSWSRALNLLPKAIKNRVTQELERRTWVPPAGVQIQTYPQPEIIRLALVKTSLYRRLGFSYQGLADRVYASLDRHVASHHLQGLDAIYAYEDGAATTFQAAKQQNILCLYDLPIVFYPTSRDIQVEEAKRFPKLAPALDATQEPAWKLERKEQEIQLADHIFVPSSFVQNSLLEAGAKPEKISIIPFGAPIDYFHPQPKPDKLFRTLFVGRVGPRKGVHYLLQAWQELSLLEAELLLVGINEFPVGWLDQYTKGIRHISSVPHASLNRYYSSANVLVLPSLVEGLALVQLEAMACGIPLITTPNAGGSDIVTDGVEGFIIPVRDVEALKEKLEWCYTHPEELAQMGQAARHKAEQLTWEQYRQQLASKVQEFLKQ